MSPASAPAPARRAPVVDVHAHLVPAALVAEARRDGGRYGVRVEALADGRERVVFDDGPAVRPFFGALCDTEGRLAEMDAAGIDVQVLSTWTDMAGDHLRSAQSVGWARLQNDVLADAAGRFPGRFAAMGTLPLPDVAGSCHEMRYCVEALGMRAFIVPTNGGGRELDDADLWPLWRLACDLDVLVFLHPPARQLGYSRLARNFLNNVVGNPAETTAAAVRLLLAGVPSAFPGLKCLLAHGGGYLAFQIGRVDRAHAAGATAPHKLAGTPSDALGWFYFDSILFDDRSLAYLLTRVGADRVVLGTDQPFEMRDDDAVERVRRAGLAGPALAGVLGRTTTELLAVPASDPGATHGVAAPRPDGGTT